MFEIVTQETLPLFEAFIEGHPKGHFLQSKQWAPVKPDWTWEGILSRDEEGNVRGAMSVLIRKMPGVPYKLMYAARGPVCDLDDRDAMKDLTNGAAVLAKKNNAYALRIDPDVPSDQTGFIEVMKSLGYTHHPGDKDFNGIQPCYVFRLDVKDKTEEDLLAAFELVIAGTEKKGSVLTEFEKKLVAYHEVGHAMVAYKQKNTEPVQKITIVPHTQGSLGYTLLMPEEDKTELRTKDELMAKIAVSMGGRAAEEVVMNTMTNGAAQDIQDATSIARNMVAMFGMSDEFGMMALASRRNQYLDGGYGMDCAQDTAARMDVAVKELLDKCYQDAVEILKANREDMDKVVAYLMEKETITGGEMVAIIEGRDPSLVENPYASTQPAQSGFRPSKPEVIEPPARNIHIVSEPPVAPKPTEEEAAEEQDSGNKPE